MPNSANRRRLVTFTLGDRQYALDAGVVERIVPLPEVDRPPQAPSLLYGFLNLAGDTLPVIHLQRLFRLPETAPGMWTPLIVVRVAGLHAALLVDRVNQVVGVEAEEILPLPAGHVLNDCLEGAWHSAAGLVPLLAPHRLLFQEEAAVLAELRETARRRIDELQGTTA